MDDRWTRGARFAWSLLLSLCLTWAVGCGDSDEDTPGIGVGGSAGSGGTNVAGTGGSNAGGSSGTAGSGGTGGSITGPTALEAIGANGTVGLDWAAVSGATGYNLYWSSTPGVTPQTGQQIGNVDRGYIHRGLTNGDTYYYVVTALGDAGETGSSNEASAVPGGEWVLEQLGTGDFQDVRTDTEFPPVPIDQRVHVLLFPEGYVAADLPKFHDHTDHDGPRSSDVDSWVDLVFGIEPYSLLPEAFVVWYLPRASNTTIRDPNPDTAFDVPVIVGSGFPQMGTVPRDGITAQLVWEAIAAHPYPPTEFNGPGTRRARNLIAAFLIYDPDRGEASVSGRSTTLENPSNDQQLVGTAFGVGHAHEFTHAFSRLGDEYLENDNSAPSSWSETSNVAGTNLCSELPWAHLLVGSEINPTTAGLVGAFGIPSLGYHPELLCLMNGTHDNGDYYGDNSGSDCTPSSCRLRVEDRMCNFCRETTALRIYQRAGLLDVDSVGVTAWISDYRKPFYDLHAFQTPGTHYDGLLPQSNDVRTPADGVQIFEDCVP